MSAKPFDNSNRAEKFRKALLKWFATSRRQDPWRNNPTPYSAWIAEVMLQQTVVKAVIPYYEAWMKRWPEIGSLAAASEQTVLRQWEGLGYYSRARNLHSAARTIVAQFDGKIPEDHDQLIQLPGIGEYTAAAILSIAFKKPYPVIDANVRRVVGRLLASPAGQGTTDATLLEFLNQAISRREPGRFNEAIMELGQTICRSRNPLCPTCPVRNLCLYWTNADRGLSKLTASKPKIVLNSLVLVVACGDKILLERKRSGRFSNMWSLPTRNLPGKLSAKEIAAAAYSLGIGNPLNHKILRTRRHIYTKYSDTLNPVVVAVRKTKANLAEHHYWVPTSDLETHPMPAIHRTILREYLDS